VRVPNGDVGVVASSWIHSALREALSTRNRADCHGRGRVVADQRWVHLGACIATTSFV
jgi:hypothetical protein